MRPLQDARARPLQDVALYIIVYSFTNSDEEFSCKYPSGSQKWKMLIQDVLNTRMHWLTARVLLLKIAPELARNLLVILGKQLNQSKTSAELRYRGTVLTTES